MGERYIWVRERVGDFKSATILDTQTLDGAGSPMYVGEILQELGPIVCKALNGELVEKAAVVQQQACKCLTADQVRKIVRDMPPPRDSKDVITTRGAF